MAYQELNEIFEKLDADYCAAEAHGISVGMLCVESRADIDNWFRALFIDESTIDDEDIETLTQVFEQTRSLLTQADQDYVFDLLLPDADEPLFEQVEALRDWCQGFLLGIGYAQSNGQWPGEIAELIADIIEITKVDIETQDEEEANALMEVHEYLRVAVMNIRDFFAETEREPQH